MELESFDENNILRFELRKNNYTDSLFEYLYTPNITNEENLAFWWFSKNVDNVYLNLMNKKVLDVWSGYTWLLLSLKDTQVDLSLVDPLFNLDSDSQKKLLQRNISHLSEIIKKEDQYLQDCNNSLCSNNNLELDFSPLWRAMFQDKVNADKKIENRRSLLQKSKKRNAIKEQELKERLRLFDDQVPNSIALYWDVWEKITSIDDDSQDYVFSSFALDKDTVDPKHFLLELKRVVKKDWWVVYLINNKWVRIERILKDNNIPYKEEQWFFITKRIF